MKPGWAIIAGRRHWQLIVSVVWVAMVTVGIEVITPFPFLKPLALTIAAMAAVLGTIWSVTVIVMAINKWRKRHEVG